CRVCDQSFYSSLGIFNQQPTDSYALYLHDALPICIVAGEQAGRALRLDDDDARARVAEGVGQVTGHRGGEPADAGLHERVSGRRSEEHTSELQSREKLVCRLLLEKKKIKDRED